MLAIAQLNDSKGRVLVSGVLAADDKIDESGSANELWQQEHSQSCAVRETEEALLAQNDGGTLKEQGCSAGKLGH